MTPEIGSSFWPQSSTIEDLCMGMIKLNLTAAKNDWKLCKVKR